MYNLVAFDIIGNLKNQFKLIHKECSDQFVAAVLQWYQHEVLYPPIPFMGDAPDCPPNIFNVIEYQDANSDVVINLFTDSDINRMMEMFHYDYPTAREKSVLLSNDKPVDYQFLMLNDIELVLNGYNLFYCYHDDANANPIYKNPYVKEVW